MPLTVFYASIDWREEAPATYRKGPTSSWTKKYDSLFSIPQYVEKGTRAFIFSLTPIHFLSQNFLTALYRICKILPFCSFTAVQDCDPFYIVSYYIKWVIFSWTLVSQFEWNPYFLITVRKRWIDYSIYTPEGGEKDQAEELHNKMEPYDGTIAYKASSLAAGVWPLWEGSRTERCDILMGEHTL